MRPSSRAGGYAVSVLVMALVAIVVGYVMLRLQDVLPLNPNVAAAQSPDLAFNTAVSFETNTNWQNYCRRVRGELSDTDGDARRPQLHVRGDRAGGRDRAGARPDARTARTIGNYWVDLTRGILYILLPISIVFAVILVWQGVPQTFDGPATVDHASGRPADHRPGPVASQESIKELGNNGGGSSTRTPPTRSRTRPR